MFNSIFRISSFLIMIALFPRTVLSQDLTKGLLACYSFSGDASDGSGHGNDGVLHGGRLTADRFGNPNSAYQFDGTNDYVDVPTSTLLNPFYSYSMWLYVPELPAVNKAFTIISIGDDQNNQQTVRIWTDQFGTSYIQFAPNFKGTVIHGPLNMKFTDYATTNKWFHLTAELGVNYILMTVDTKGDVLIEGDPFPDIDYGDPAIGRIGAKTDSNEAFKGMIDDVTFYNRVLRSEEVRLLYMLRTSCPGLDKPVVQSPTLCGAGSVSILAGPGTHYRWYDAPTDGNLLLQGNPFTTPELTQTTNYYVSFYNDTSESARTFVVVTVAPSPVVVCGEISHTSAGVPFTYSAAAIQGTAPFLFKFDFGDGHAYQASTSPMETNTYPAGGDYTITVTVNDKNHCSAFCTETISVTALPVVRDTFLCGPGAVALSAFGGNIYKWYLDPESAVVEHEGNPFITPQLTTTTAYYVSSTQDGYESTRAKVTVNIYPKLIADCNSFGDVLTNTPVTGAFQVSGGTPPFVFTFDSGNGQTYTSKQPSLQFQYDQSGDYPVSVMALDAKGCASSCTTDLKVYDTFAPNIITVNSDALNDHLTLFKTLRNQISEYNGTLPFQLKVLDRWGNEIYSTTDIHEGWRGVNEAPGNYFFALKYAGKEMKGWVTLVKAPD